MLILRVRLAVDEPRHVGGWDIWLEDDVWHWPCTVGDARGDIHRVVGVCSTDVQLRDILDFASLFVAFYVILLLHGNQGGKPNFVYCEFAI
jgi:hypothetical protein